MSTYGSYELGRLPIDTLRENKINHTSIENHYRPYFSFLGSRKEGGNLSLELIIKVLIDLGLSRVDAELYVYLAKKGPQKMVDLVKALTYKKAKIYSSLRNLQTKKLVSKNPPMFCALPFEEALELLIKSKKEQTEVMIEYKKELLVR